MIKFLLILLALYFYGRSEQYKTYAIEALQENERLREQIAEYVYTPINKGE